MARDSEDSKYVKLLLRRGARLGGIALAADIGRRRPTVQHVS